MKVFLNILETCLLCVSLYTYGLNYGLNYFRYFASKKWNSLLNNVRSEPALSGLKDSYMHAYMHDWRETFRQNICIPPPPL